MLILPHINVTVAIVTEAHGACIFILLFHNYSTLSD